MRRMALIAGVALLAALAGAFAGRAWAGPLWTAGELAPAEGENRPGRLGQPDLSGPEGQDAPELPALPPGLRGSIRRVDTGGQKLVAFTFDLCELSDQRAGYDGALVQTLRELDAPATFFAGGKWMRSHPQRAMQLLSDPLFEVGSHGWTHGNMAVLDAGGMRRQIDWTQAQYAVVRERLQELARQRGAPDAVAAVPGAMRLYRFPYGRCRAEALEMLAAKGIAAVQWDVNTMDAAKGRSAQAITADALRAVKPGSIVLGHANGFGRATAEALRTLIPELRARGYRLVTVSALLASGRAVTAGDCYDSRPGDTAVYDAQYGDGTVHRRAPRPQ